MFSGGGGFDLAAEKMGWENVFHCEKDTFCQTILKHYWPKANSHHDIGEFDARHYKGQIDILTGGFPCQPFSAAGKRQGTSDDRYLWPEMYRIIREVKPRWVVCENVYGLVSWNNGLVFDTVQSDLEAEGYKVAAYVLPASGVNAPHQRYRVWIVGLNSEYAPTRQTKAYSNSNSFRWKRTRLCSKAPKRRKCRQCHQIDGLCTSQLEETITYTNCKRLQLQKTNCQLAGRRPRFKSTNARWQDWPTEPPLCGGDDGLPARLDNITIPKWRTQSIRMFGNAIVPEIALQLFKTIEGFERMHC